MNESNVILRTDSYKLTHAPMYPEGTTRVYSYLEARTGAKDPYTVFFGLQKILESIEGVCVTLTDLSEAAELAEHHLGPDVFNYDGWKHIIDEHGGKLPIRIKAAPEGSVIPISNVLMTVENTCDSCYWLTNAVESLLLHVWYPITVATRSRRVKEFYTSALHRTSDTLDAIPFMLHDFGYRGASSDQSAAIGGAAHLVNFMGTDTLLAMVLLKNTYAAELDSIAYSVPASEHSVMTALGPDGEYVQVDRILENYPTGIVSLVADSYDYYEFVKEICRDSEHIKKRDGKVVVRPDSTTPIHQNPGQLVVWTLHELWNTFGGTINSKGFKVLDPHIGILWGDGIDADGIEKIVNAAILAGFSAENLVFGMGGGLLQKVNRDTERFAFKCSAQMRDGKWVKIRKVPLDKSKASKGGLLALVKLDGEYTTLTDIDGDAYVGCLQTVFENGEITKRYTLKEVRENAQINC